MMEKRRLFNLAVLVMALVLSAACAVPVAAPSDAGGGEAPAGATVTVVYWAHNFEPRVALDQKYIAEFM